MVEAFKPASLAEALKIRSDEHAIPFAGGTDLMVRFRARDGMAPSFGLPIVFVDSLPELNTVQMHKGGLMIGASVPLSILIGEVAGSRMKTAPDAAALALVPPVLRDAMAAVGAPAIRNRATMGGNLASASPAGDSIAALYALRAEIILNSLNGERRILIEKFILGPGETNSNEDEIIRAIHIPAPLPNWSYWRKVGTRRTNALTKVSLAAAASIANGKVESCILAFGAVGPRIVRAPDAEELLRDQLAAAPEVKLKEIIAKAASLVSPLISPIDDQRSTARYRGAVALNLMGDAIESLKGRLHD